VDIRSAQKLAWENKLSKGFNSTDVPLEFCLLNGEIAEAFDAWRKGHQEAAEELADVAIFLLSLAEMTGTDLQDAIEAKLATNAVRIYQRLSNGALVKSSASDQNASCNRNTHAARIPVCAALTDKGKLVRDKIPQIIRSRGSEPIVRVLGAAEYREMLLAKLAEEVDEVRAADDAEAAEELADVCEVVLALASDLGLNAGQLEELRAAKAAERGGFADRIAWSGNVVP